MTGKDFLIGMAIVNSPAIIGKLFKWLFIVIMIAMPIVLIDGVGYLIGGKHMFFVGENLEVKTKKLEEHNARLAKHTANTSLIINVPNNDHYIWFTLKNNSGYGEISVYRITCFNKNSKVYQVEIRDNLMSNQSTTWNINLNEFSGYPTRCSAEVLAE